MRKFLYPLITLVCALCLAACERDERCTYFPTGITYCLQPSHSVHPFEVSQKIEITINDVRETMIAELEVDQLGMRIAAVSPLGYKVLQLRLDDQGVHRDTWPDDRLDPAMLLALMQISLWPPEVVNAGFGNAPYFEAQDHLRTLSREGTLILRVHAQDKISKDARIELSLPTVGLHLEITPLQSVTPHEQ